MGVHVPLTRISSCNKGRTGHQRGALSRRQYNALLCARWVNFLWIHLLSASDTSFPSATVMQRFFENIFISAERVIYNEIYKIRVVLRARGKWIQGTDHTFGKDWPGLRKMLRDVNVGCRREMIILPTSQGPVRITCDHAYEGVQSSTRTNELQA